MPIQTVSAGVGSLRLVAGLLLLRRRKLRLGVLRLLLSLAGGRCVDGNRLEVEGFLRQRLGLVLLHDVGHGDGDAALYEVW